MLQTLILNSKSLKTLTCQLSKHLNWTLLTLKVKTTDQNLINVEKSNPALTDPQSTWPSPRRPLKSYIRHWNRFNSVRKPCSKLENPVWSLETLNCNWKPSLQFETQYATHSNWAGGPFDRRSVTKYSVFLGKNLVNLRSKKQTVVVGLRGHAKLDGCVCF